jgi:hypothetical protein
MVTTPWIAICERCLFRFFTPQDLFGDPNEAEKCLREKFYRHTCKTSSPTTRNLSIRSARSSS